MVMSVDGLDALVTTLAGFGYETKGPVVHDGAILPGPVQGVSDLPVGTGDVQSPGRYRLEQRDDDAVFGWAVGPGSWKAEFFPPTQELWRSTVDGDAISITTPIWRCPRWPLSAPGPVSSPVWLCSTGCCWTVRSPIPGTQTAGPMPSSSPRSAAPLPGPASARRWARDRGRSRLRPGPHRARRRQWPPVRGPGRHRAGC